MRSTSDRKPLDRCAVRWAPRPSSSKTAPASMARISRGVLSLKSEIAMATSSANDHRVAVAHKMELGRAAFLFDARRKPNLAGAPTHPICLDVLRFRQGLERFSELNDVAISVLPIFQEGKVGFDFIDHRCGPDGLQPYSALRRAKDKKEIPRAERAGTARGVRQKSPQSLGSGENQADLPARGSCHFGSRAAGPRWTSTDDSPPRSARGCTDEHDPLRRRPRPARRAARR